VQQKEHQKNYAFACKEDLTYFPGFFHNDFIVNSIDLRTLQRKERSHLMPACYQEVLNQFKDESFNKSALNDSQIKENDPQDDDDLYK